MTYGWALLVIVVVGAALFALGILNPGTYSQSRCTGFQYFTFQDQKVTTTNFLLSLINGDKDITSLGGFAISTTPGGTDLGVVPVVITAPTGIISGTNNFTISRDFTSGKSIGSTFSYSVAITYDTPSIPGRIDRGACTGKIQ